MKGGTAMEENRSVQPDGELFSTPFCKEYWIQAFREFRNLKMLLFAALMVALRVALKSVSIPVGADLRIGVGFFVNAFGSMVYGPVVAVLGAAVSDTLGALLFPTGPYFPLFLITEAAGSVLFALFLYRTDLTVTRVTLSRFCIDFFVNIVLNTPVMMLYYRIMLGKSYRILHWPRIVKNLVMFPIESVLLVLFLRTVMAGCAPLGIIHSRYDRLRFSKKNIAVLAVLTLIGAAAVIIYIVWKNG